MQRRDAVERHIHVRVRSQRARQHLSSDRPGLSARVHRKRVVHPPGNTHEWSGDRGVVLQDAVLRGAVGTRVGRSALAEAAGSAGAVASAVPATRAPLSLVHCAQRRQLEAARDDEGEMLGPHRDLACRDKHRVLPRGRRLPGNLL
eukprot:3039999-Rhodomonas_salina.2